MYYVGVYRVSFFSTAAVGIYKKKQELGQFSTSESALNFIKDKMSVGQYDIVCFWDDGVFDVTRVKWTGRVVYLDGYKASSYEEYSQFVQSRVIAANEFFSDEERAQHAAIAKDFLDKQRSR